ncbi:MAG: fumarate reductase (CoM/CoB) subunit [Actinomycetota bacterium]|jgi:succinate dehydrogenase/fumarate reductase flavoprotein subunit|nr:fumarate reductase (CoM/CoB) subunit [Actinomycetota bacterium]
MEELTADVVVAGGGVGGLMATVAAAEAGSRVVLLAGSPGASHQISSINAAFGVSAEDTAERLFDDMFRAGQYVNNPAMTARIAETVGDELLRLGALGVPFVRDGAGFARRRAAGSSWTRAVFTQNMVGDDISEMLLALLHDRFADTVTVVAEGWLVDLRVADGAVTGVTAYGRRAAEWIAISASAVVVATGGGGQLFAKSTNQPGSRGNGYVMAAEAGAALMDLEFISFEPFVLQNPEAARGRSVPTTLMSEGARLLNARGEEFLGGGPMPNKDVVSRAMVREVREGRGTPSGAVIYDLSPVSEESLARYPKVGRSIIATGAPLLEVMPAQHYFMGGIRTTDDGATSVPGLFAVGEAAAGSHGAHRIAGSGGSEVVALGPVVGRAAHKWATTNRPWASTESWALPELLSFKPDELERAWTDRVRSTLDFSCGILRSAGDLEEATHQVSELRNEIRRAGRSRSAVARATLLASGIVSSALLRTESRGDHYRVDFPVRDDYNWLGNLVATLPAGGTEFEHEFVAR